MSGNRGNGMFLDFVGNRRWFYLFSLIVLLPGAISLIIPPRLTLGIDFEGGTEFSVRFQEPVSQGDLQDALADLDHHAGALMAQDGREGALRVGPREGELVGVADPGGLDLDHHLAGFRAVEVDLGDLQLLARLEGDRGACSHGFLPPVVRWISETIRGRV